MIIDAHQHFWDVSRGEYAWLRPNDPILYQNYLPKDLVPLLSESDVAATVLIQAAPSELETQYLFRLSGAHSFIAGVVGWVDLDSPEADRRIANLIADGQGKLKGLRPMIQDIVEADWVMGSALDRAFQSMIDHDLAFDALVRPSQLPALRLRLLRHPGLRVVLDHAGKPPVAAGDFDAWARNLERLAQDTSASVKMSGILTEAGNRTTFEELRPYVEHIFRCFGPERMMWGSDWPVLNRASRYGDWLDQSAAWVRRYAPRYEEEIFARTAMRMYQLEIPPNPPHLSKPKERAA